MAILSREEKEIEDFVIRCSNDFPFYCESLLKIQDKNGNLIPFRLNKCQLRIWEIVKEHIDSREPVRMIILKARQMGISTEIQAIIYYIISMNENRSAIVVAHSQDSSESLFSKQKLFFKCMPTMFQPMIKKSNRKELHFANPDDKGNRGLESRVIVNTADNEQMGRSFTLQLAHLSEFAFWEKMGYEPKKRLGALNNSITDKEGTFIFIESTADGEGYFKSLWDDDDIGYSKVFLSWVADETYRLPVFEEDYNSFKLSDNVENIYGDEVLESGYIADQVRFWYKDINDDDLLVEVLARLNWRRKTIVNKCEKDWRLFQQEYPTIPEQAFIASGSNIFNAQALNVMSKNAKQPMWFRFDFDAARDGLNDVLMANDSSRKELVSEYFEESQIKRSISIYEYPKNNFKYCIGGDAAEGVAGGDHSSILVLCINTMEEVCSFDGIIDPVSYAYLVNAIGILFNNALVAVEANDNGGGTATHVLQRKLLYKNLYFRQKLETAKHYKREEFYGWKTNRSSKSRLISEMYTFIDNEDIVFHSYELIKQLKLFKLFEDGSTGVEKPEHDDFAIAGMIALQMAITINIPKDKEKPIARRGITIKKLIDLHNKSQIKNTRISGVNNGYL